MRVSYPHPTFTTGHPAPNVSRDAQTRSVPFENIDVALRKTISMEPEDVTRKMLDQKRGGVEILRHPPPSPPPPPPRHHHPRPHHHHHHHHLLPPGYCFEQNTLLKLALEAIGFKVHSLLCRVRWGKRPDEQTAFTHMCLRVDLEGGGGPYLADVGFAGTNRRVHVHVVTDCQSQRWIGSAPPPPLLCCCVDPLRPTVSYRALHSHARRLLCSIEPISLDATAPLELSDGTWWTEERDGYVFLTMQEREEEGAVGRDLYCWSTVGCMYPDLLQANHWSCTKVSCHA